MAEAFEAIEELRGQGVPYLVRALCEIKREAERSKGWLTAIALSLGLRATKHRERVHAVWSALRAPGRRRGGAL